MAIWSCSYEDSTALPEGTIAVRLQGASGFLLSFVDILMSETEYGSLVARIPETIQIDLRQSQSDMLFFQQSETPRDYSNSILFYQGWGAELALVDTSVCIPYSAALCLPEVLSDFPPYEQADGSFRYANIYSPRWSPNREMIAFIYDGEETGYLEKLYLISPVPSTESMMTGVSTASLLSGSFQPTGRISWTADGTSILLNDFQTKDLYRIVYDDSCVAPDCSSTQLTGDGNITFESSPVESPDGSRIVYTVSGDLWMMNADGSNSQLLLDDPGNIAYSNPDWSPDGSRIAFDSSKIVSGGNESNIYMCSLSLSPLACIPQQASRTSTRDGIHSRDVSWSPDGNYLVYSEYQRWDNPSRLVIVDVNQLANPNPIPLMAYEAMYQNSADWGFPSNEQCAYAPIPRTRYSTNNPDTSEDETQYALGINFRSAPSSSSTALGVFWGVKLGPNNLPINSNNVEMNLLFADYLNVTNLGVVHLNAGSVTYRTDNRRFTPLHQYLAADGIWYLAEYNKSLAWVHSNLVDISNCGRILELPQNDARLNLDTYYNFPLSSGQTAIAPDPSVWVPFGECVPNTVLESILERCAYELYVQVFEDARFRDGLGNPNLRMEDVLGIVLLGELGTYLPVTSYDQLNQPQKYFIEAAARNFAQVCAQESGNYIRPISCDLRGITKMLLQVQSFYQEYESERSAYDNVTAVIERRSNSQRITYELYTEAFAQLIFNHSSWYQGLQGSAQPVPFQWGNWLKGSGNNVYETAAGFLNGSTTNTNVVTIPQSTTEGWVYIISPSESLLVNGSVFAIQNTTLLGGPEGNCYLTFAITTTAHNLGQTDACE